MIPTYSVYILASSTGTLYVGMTNNLFRRISEHKEGKIEGFTKKYACNKLVYYESTQYVYNAIEREKEIKDMNRSKKEVLVRTMNPTWKDMYNELILGIKGPAAADDKKTYILHMHFLYPASICYTRDIGSSPIGH